MQLTEYNNCIGGSSIEHEPKLYLLNWNLFSNNDVDYMFKNLHDFFLLFQDTVLFFNWNSLHAWLYSHYEAWRYKKKKEATVLAKLI